MGRTEKSQGLAPPAIRKDIRAKQARHIVNKVVPALLNSNTRARKGAEGSELITDPGPVVAASEKPSKEDEDKGSEDTRYIKRKGQGRRKAKNTAEDDDTTSHGKSKPKDSQGPLSNHISVSAPPPLKIRIMATDTLTAAHTLIPRSKARSQPNPCILNMASPLRPGGGVLAGATSQEEYLCARTTLLSSLNESFYRLPELGGIFTRDVLVFRNHLPLGDARGELGPAERWWVDVISAGMLRFPDLEGGEEEVKRLSGKDRGVVEAKMRAVLRIACSRGVKRLVLGAWGCGAYGNPVKDVAGAWSVVLQPHMHPELGKKGKKAQIIETWDGLLEVVFAIPNTKMAREFAVGFGGALEVEETSLGPQTREEEDDVDNVAEELRAKIREMEGQIGKVRNADLKQRMTLILDGLKAQLREREDGHREKDEDSEEDIEEDVLADETESDSAVMSEEDAMEGSGVEEDDGGSRLPSKHSER